MEGVATETDLPNRFGEKVHEVYVGFMRRGLSSVQHAVVGALHKGLLKLNPVLYAQILQRFGGQKLQLSVELRNSILDQQPQKVKPHDWVLLR